ncbi:MAG: hypothetical protein M3X11_15395 [Acidobacteriota bacterium]|nr:hypothetical protein [Acidobacteriota bacterium]
MAESTVHFRDFAAAVLEQSGALVERIEPEGLEALLPAELNAQLRAGELLRAGFGAELPPDAQRISLESDWLERFGNLLDGRGGRLRIALADPFVSLSNAANPANLERMLEHSIVLPNAVYRMTGATSAWTRYLVLLFHYTAMSDEKREGVVKFGINLNQGSSIDGFVDELLSHAMNPTAISVVAPATKDLPADWSPARLKAYVSHALPSLIHDHLQLFLQGMQLRLDRDLVRVFDYYEGLRQESLLKLKKHKTDSARETLRIEAAAREYQAKVADLKQKYDLRVTVNLSQVLEILSPVQRITLLIKRRKGERKLALDWNPLVRRLEPLPCEWGYTGEAVRIVCDDALHLVGASGHAPCQTCDKEYCRACHPRQCPKCRQAGRTIQ